MRKSLLFICLWLSTLSFSEVVNAIQFAGLTKTKESYLRSILLNQVGKEYIEGSLEKDNQILRNLKLFFSVNSSASYNSAASGWDLLFEVEEATYLYPILSASGFKSQLKIQAGFNQINFRGKAEHIGLLYQFYDRHSIFGFYHVPRHHNNKTGHEISITKYSTVEPLYFKDTVTPFNFDNYNVSTSLHYWITPKLRSGIGGMYMYETYQQIDTSVFDLGQFEFFFHKYQIRTAIDYNNLDEHFERQRGLRNHGYAETIQTIDYPDISFFKFTNDFYFYRFLGKNGNLALHQRIGIATNNDSPFSPFVLDGFLNVRGVGNRIARGTAEMIVNAEYRHTLIKHNWLFLQFVSFADFGTLRLAGEEIKDMFKDQSVELFLGGGLRIHSRKLYKVIFRIDYSVNPIFPQRHGPTFGVGQFF